MTGSPYQEDDSFCTMEKNVSLANKIRFSNTAQDKLWYVVLQKGECHSIKEVYYR